MVLSVAHAQFVMSALVSTNLVAMLPSRPVKNHSALQVLELPVDVPGYETAILWQERSHRDSCASLATGTYPGFSVIFAIRRAPPE
jgi:DNA-binding transcriptional LysR family regulator